MNWGEAAKAWWVYPSETARICRFDRLKLSRARSYATLEKKIGLKNSLGHSSNLAGTPFVVGYAAM